MKLYDGKGNFIGTVTKEEQLLLTKGNDGIMPITVRLTPIREYHMPKGNHVIVIGSLIGALATVFSLFYAILSSSVHRFVWPVLSDITAPLFVLAFVIRFVGSVIAVPYNRSYVYHALVCGVFPFLLFAPIKYWGAFWLFFFFAFLFLVVKIRDGMALFGQSVLLCASQMIFFFCVWKQGGVWSILLIAFGTEVYVFSHTPQGLKRKADKSGGQSS